MKEYELKLDLLIGRALKIFERSRRVLIMLLFLHSPFIFPSTKQNKTDKQTNKQAKNPPLPSISILELSKD